MSGSRTAVMGRLGAYFSSIEDESLLKDFRNASQECQATNIITRMFDKIDSTLEMLFADEVELLVNQTKFLLDKWMNNSSVPGVDPKDVKAIQQSIHAYAAQELLDEMGHIPEIYVELFHWNIVTKQDRQNLLSAFSGTLNQIVQRQLDAMGSVYTEKYAYILNYINKNRANFLSEFLAELDESCNSAMQQKYILHDGSKKNHSRAGTALVAGGVAIAVAATMTLFLRKPSVTSQRTGRNTNSYEMTDNRTLKRS